MGKAWLHSEAANKPFLDLSTFSPGYFGLLAFILVTVITDHLDCYPP